MDRLSISLLVQKDMSLAARPVNKDPDGILQQELQKKFTETPLHPQISAAPWPPLKLIACRLPVLKLKFVFL